MPEFGAVTTHGWLLAADVLGTIVSQVMPALRLRLILTLPGQAVRVHEIVCVVPTSHASPPLGLSTRKVRLTRLKSALLVSEIPGSASDVTRMRQADDAGAVDVQSSAPSLGVSAKSVVHVAPPSLLSSIITLPAGTLHDSHSMGTEAPIVNPSPPSGQRTVIALSAMVMGPALDPFTDG